MITFLTILLGGLRCHPYYQYATVDDFSFHRKMKLNDTLRIAFIGDSWAAYHHGYDSLLQVMLVSDSLPVAVKSQGNVGAKSKEIYERLTTTMKSLLEWQPNYCVISAGINDAVAKLGEDFYVFHYGLIISQLLEMGIKPIILEIPDVNYKLIAEREPILMYLHHMVSAFLMNSDLYDFKSYRRALSKKVFMTDWKNRVIYIKAAQWNPQGFLDNRNLYLTDDTHLNTKGYHVLDSCIASEIRNDRFANQITYQ